jgi:Fic family protein
MQQISTLKSQPLTKDLVLELQSIVTEGTLDDPSASGRFRRDDEQIVVTDLEGTTYHVPPVASELDWRMALMCDFANGDEPKSFVHPVLRSMTLHFWLAYNHPFVDGNGRTARALFYWSMLHYGYWVCEYLSISHIIRKTQAKYSHAFLLTETDDNDLTYFMIYHIDVLREAVTALDKYVHEKTLRLRDVEHDIRSFIYLNHRQRALVSHALRHPGATFTTQGHRTSHGISYNTARADLDKLAADGLLQMRRFGRKTYYLALTDLESKLSEKNRNG